MAPIFKSPGRLVTTGRWHPMRCLTGLMMAVLLSAATGAPARAQVFDQYQVKAVFLYNLTNFITWPPRHAPGQSATFTIGLLGRDTMGAFLDQAVAGETAAGRKIRVERLTALEQIQAQPCDLLFIGSDQIHLWPQIREIARAHRILTVSEVEGFGRRGGIVNLLTTGRKIHIEINVEEARRSGFEISAKLLKLARIITGGKEE